MNGHDEILDLEHLNFNKIRIYKYIGIAFFVSVPLILFLVANYDDAGIFLPRNEITESLIPNSLVYLKDQFSIRILTLEFIICIGIYLVSMGVINFKFWKSDNQIKFRIFHTFITIGFIIIFCLTMVQDDIFHDISLMSQIGKEQFHQKATVFYNLLTFWSVLQITYFVLLFTSKYTKIYK